MLNLCLIWPLRPIGRVAKGKTAMGGPERKRSPGKRGIKMHENHEDQKTDVKKRNAVQKKKKKNVFKIKKSPMTGD